MSELRSTAAIRGHPIHPMLVPFPIVCFIGALVCDAVYAGTAQMQWSNFAAWLLAAGVVIGALAAIAGIAEVLGSRGVRRLGIVWLHGAGNAVAMVLAVLNCLVHTHDAWTSVVPWGLTLSAITVLILLATGWLGGELVYRRGVGQAWRGAPETPLSTPGPAPRAGDAP